MFSPDNMLRLLMYEDGWSGCNDLYVQDKSCYYSTLKAVANVLDWMMCRAELEREKLCTEQELNSVEEEQHSSDTLVVDQESNTRVFVTNTKAFVISAVSLEPHLPA